MSQRNRLHNKKLRRIKRMASKTPVSKNFTTAELNHIKNKAQIASAAINDHNQFVAFLREQHNAPESEGWQLGMDGFVQLPEKEENPDDMGTPPDSL